jgi:pimeloyl-ACP methyl ester carboxylesterase
LSTSGYYKPPAARLGSGRLGVVFANDSDNETCTWSSEARALAAKGYAVAVFETVGNYGFEAREVKAVAAALRRAGARRVALIGASVGARAVLQVGAQRPDWLAGVVALSAERRINSNPSDLLPVGRRIRVPVLSVGSRQDPYTSFGKDTRAWDRTIPDDKALMLSGSGHGVEFLSGPHGPRVRAAVMAFLRSL